jgi:hypothetical protein
MNTSNILDTCQQLPSAESSFLSTLGWWNWQTRTFEGRMPKGLRVQVPPRARFASIAVAVRAQLRLFVVFLVR